MGLCVMFETYDLISLILSNIINNNCIYFSIFNFICVLYLFVALRRIRDTAVISENNCVLSYDNNHKDFLKQINAYWSWEGFPFGNIFFMHFLSRWTIYEQLLDFAQSSLFSQDVLSRCMVSIHVFIDRLILVISVTIVVFCYLLSIWDRFPGVFSGDGTLINMEERKQWLLWIPVCYFSSSDMCSEFYLYIW